MTQPALHQLHAVIHGRVQGVGFRDVTHRRALDLGITGWVRNQSDGTVETLAQGDRAALERFLAFLHRGPVSAQVSRVDAEWSAVAQPLTDFRVR